jgi:hypothetical protein
VKRLAALAVVLLVISVDSARSERPETQTVFRYLGVRWCQGCHSRRSPNPKLRVYHSWEDSVHARVWESLPAEDRENPGCLRCHTTGYGMPRRSDVPDKELRGVQCEACHGPGSHYFTWSVMKNRNLAQTRGLVIPTRETCAKCHW